MWFDPLEAFFIEESRQQKPQPAPRERFRPGGLRAHPDPPRLQWVLLLHLVSSLLRLDKMYERHKRRYSLCDISKVDRTVDVVLLKVRGLAAASFWLCIQ